MPAVKSAPLQLMHDAHGTKVTVETEHGETFTGTLESIEDNMNLQLTEVTNVKKTGKERQLESIYIRGSTVVLFQLADALKHSIPDLSVQVDAKGPAASKGRGGGGGGGASGPRFGGGGRGRGGAGQAGEKRKRD